MQVYIVYYEISNETIWYLTDIRYYDRPEIDWILHYGAGKEIQDAMIFSSKSKCEKLCAILSNQLDDHGQCEKWFYKEIK